MIWEKLLKDVGKRAKVVSNSERDFRHSYIGLMGEIIGVMSGDYQMKFDNGITTYIYSKDVQLI